ncbi:hypothetical protein SynWH8101_2711 [Synechococcus sp. WH 8101]|uniref:hypothetical protein n=1 Tax=Synechococcus sp. WH 8101 TaxID=59932 RepID=UPI001023DE57|nr:hypothetical protein [Synechococcus sp. WH 8101]QBE70277.1 hypothetical protein SynWH8101_2711 [Synechococcus sp. WH 8101]QNI46548.1 hypothetical protein SynRCC2555_02781 [Synechococcus sp. WH 8101]
MHRSLSLLSALALGSTALVIAHGPKADAMAIAFDCFDRTTSQLVARSAVDMTSPIVSCLPVPGTSTTPAQTSPSPTSPDPVIEIGTSEADFTGGGAVEPDFSDPAVPPAPEMSTGDQLGSAVGQHLGKLLGQGIADLFR